ncbi:hypothetical protein Adi01nite_66810 [Amorphoplanes digitatis]|nr:hypothetical protein GCM10020092_092380 [Actinoplanes digitatis]GID97269.1 hypothetical protein Adi01nite_66810 [Actinoplanes digitatis]
MPIEANVFAQACGIRTNHGSGSDVQVAVIVRNSRSSVYYAEAAVQINRPGPRGRWECLRAGVAAHSWSVCFGETVYEPSDVSVLEAGVNSTFLSVISTAV